MSRALRLVVAAAFVVGSAFALSCNVNDYCLNCATLGDGGPSDAIDAPVDSDVTDAGDGGNCTNTGTEVCDDKDNDCDGAVDELPIAGIGDPCMNQTGECAGGVTECVAGKVECTKKPAPEDCDNLDNNCNGTVDEGDPDGGDKCGTDVGECVAGVNRCTNGTIQCIGAVGSVGGQPETCNGRDDDCDGMFDEGLTNLGQCGTTDLGECSFGTQQCMGGGVVCVGAMGPTFELCDSLDQDCDGNPTNGYNLMTDEQNCGMCGMVCNLPNAVEVCNSGTCGIASCQAGYHNNDGNAANGCEFGPCQPSGNEVCDGMDNDCDGVIDDNLGTPPAICLSGGECGTPAPTAQCMGAMGWRCTYSGNVQTDANGNIVAETRCDGDDNDCDGQIDENQPNLNDACNDGGVGLCQGTGTYQCNSANLNGPAVCVITNPGGTMTAETCDGVDNDCDGVVDDGASSGNLPGQDWITIPGTSPAVQIQKWEASRPDATSTSSGSVATHLCSKQGVLPWTNVTHPQAQAACAAIGARLCTEAEWERMCDPRPQYPVTGPAAGQFVFLEAEDAFARVAGTQDTWTATPISDYSGTTSFQALGDNGQSQSAANAPSNSPRFAFQLSLAASTQYFVWVRMRSPGSNSDTLYTGISATTPGTVTGAAIATGVHNQWVWRVGTGVTTGAAGTYHAHVYMAEDGVLVDAVAIARQGTTPPTFDERTWAFATNPKVAQTTVCNGDPYDTVAGGTDQDDILPTGSLASCFANGPGSADAFDMSGNVKEWTAERAAGQNPLRGGASNSLVDGLTCGLDFTLADDQFFFPNVGFRCCR